MRAALRSNLVLLFLLLPCLLLPAPTSPVADRQPIDEALRWVRNSPRGLTEYDYMMTARVHLLFFWAGKDDVGGGYIRRGVSAEDPRMEIIQVLFGSDPEKAPRAINRWGAGTEISWHKEPVASSHAEDVTASAFFGFMKSSQGKSAAEMQAELGREKQLGLHAFTGILSRVEPARAISLVVPLQSETDFSLRDYHRAEPLMLEHLATSARPPRSLQEPQRCQRSAEFLASVAELIDAAIDGARAPVSRCYIYDAQENTLFLARVTPQESLPVRLHGPDNVVLLDATYRKVLQLDFVSTHKLTGKQVDFKVYVGSEGTRRGVPVQICYQPNWWFEVILNLVPEKPARSDSAAASANN
jgi:hypothetical protein